MKEKEKGRGNEMFVAGGKMQVGTAKQGAKAVCGCTAGNSGDLGTLLKFICISGHYRNNLVSSMRSSYEIIE